MIKKNDPDHPDIAGILKRIGDVYNNEFYYEKALENYKKSEKIYKKVYADYHVHFKKAGILKSIGDVYYNKSDSKKALENYENSRDIYKIIHDDNPDHPNPDHPYPDHPNIAGILKRIGDVYNNEFDYEKALEYYKKSEKIYEKVYDHYPNHPDKAGISKSFGDYYYNKSDSKKALENYEKSYKIYEIVYADDLNQLDIAGILERIGKASLYDEYHSQSIFNCRFDNGIKKLRESYKIHNLFYTNDYYYKTCSCFFGCIDWFCFSETQRCSEFLSLLSELYFCIRCFPKLLIIIFVLILCFLYYFRNEILQIINKIPQIINDLDEINNFLSCLINSSQSFNISNISYNCTYSNITFEGSRRAFKAS